MSDWAYKAEGKTCDALCGVDRSRCVAAEHLELRNAVLDLTMAASIDKSSPFHDHEAVRKFEEILHCPVADDRDPLEAMIAAARRAGAEAMRERAAKVAAGQSCDEPHYGPRRKWPECGEWNRSSYDDLTKFADAMSDAIRALEIEG